jgi:hypothetical protein
MTEPATITVYCNVTVRFADADDSAKLKEVSARLGSLTAERDELAERLATLSKLVPLAEEVAKHLEASIASWFFGPGDDHPALRARYDRAMQPVRELRALLATVP